MCARTLSRCQTPRRERITDWNDQTMHPNEIKQAVPLATVLAPQAICDEVLLEKYAKGGERTVDEVRRRVARALAAVEPEAKRAQFEEAFFRAQVAGFIPGGR